jgi:cell division protein FtsB
VDSGDCAMIRVLLILLVIIGSASAQTVEQRLGGVIGSCVVQNTQLAAELDAAKQTLAQLRAEIEKLKSKEGQ